MIKKKVLEGTFTIQDLFNHPNETFDYIKEVENSKVVAVLEGEKVFLYRKNGNAITFEITELEKELEKRLKALNKSPESLKNFIALLGESGTKVEVISLIMRLVDTLRDLLQENISLVGLINSLKNGEIDNELMNFNEEKVTIQ